MDVIQEKTPLVSVVIPTYNRLEKLKTTISHLKQIPRPGFEVIVVDNNSDGHIEAAVRAIMPSVRYVRLKRNIGAAARNIGVRLSKSKYVLMLDDDSHPHADAMERMVSIFDKHPDYGIISFRVFLSDGSLESTGCHNVFLGCAAGMRREVFDAAGGYPPEYHYYVEEYDLSYRVLEAGYKIAYVEDCVAVHNRDTGRNMSRIIYYLIRNNMNLNAKYFPVSIMLRKTAEAVSRYRAIAAKENVTAQFYRGLLSGAWQAIKGGLTNRSVLSPATVDEILQTEYLRRKFREKGLAHARGKKIGLVGIGKIFSSFLGICRELQLDITGVYDADQGFFHSSRRDVYGMSVQPLERIAADGAEELIVCTSDLSTQRKLSLALFSRYPACKVHTFFE